MKILEINIPSIEGKHEVESSENIGANKRVIVSNGQITEAATVLGIRDARPNEKSKSEWKLIRLADEKDKKKIKELESKAQGYLPICREKIQNHSLALMNLLNAKLSFDEKKLTIYFSAEGRVDFRDLVLDLVKTFKKIIRLQQIGSRDEARMLGGVGKCGREFCCSNHLADIKSVTLDDAKEQDIVFGVNKLSGACGKLMCCLVFELDDYKKLAKSMPKVGDEVKFNKENCRVISRSLIKQTYTVENNKGIRTEVEK